MDTMMAHQTMHPAFFYYSSDVSSEQRQQRHYMSHPHPHAVLQQQMTVFPVVPTLPSTPIYSRPGSSCSQPAMHQKVFAGMPSALTPVASPQPLAHKPSIVLDTDFGDVDGLYYPSTPPLSSSGSAISSPGSCEVLQTPLNPMFSGLDGVEAKGVQNVDGKLESFPSLDWASCTSPPMTPVYLPSQTPALKFGSLSSSTNNIDLLSTTLSCPSLSPSPSPYARSVSSGDIDFCDPRNLTVGTVNSTLAPDLSGLPNLSVGSEEEHELVLKGQACTETTPFVALPNESFEFNPLVSGALPTFDEFDDLDSENDFVNGLVNLGDHPAVQTSRSRASSDAVSLGQSSFTCEDDIRHSPSNTLLDAATACDSEAHKNKRQRKEAPEPIMTTTADPHSGSTQQQTTPAADNSSNNASDAKNSSESNSMSDNAPHTPLPAPTNRRGRKQSLTEDPSKTFVCDLCNRRFRRQEHLKRHYRSLHTQEKPFECHECGKKFSRSDNLAQHARTHGSGAIVMNLIDDPEAMAAASMHHGAYHHMMAGTPLTSTDDYHTLGQVLFQVTSEVPGSASELSSDEGSDHDNKKRKRVE